MPLPYQTLDFPAAPADRPYVFINMVTTIDGKILTGERDEPVMDLGSASDHAVMRRIEAAADAVMVGAGVIRATPRLWYEKRLKRIVVTSSGTVPWDNRFFTDAPEQAFVATNAPIDLPHGVGRLPVDIPELLRVLRLEYGVQHLLVEGGSELNASLLQEDVVDELFLTLAPKIKLGRDIPTYADGDPLPRADIRQYELVECHQVEDELFMRYRRKTA